MPNNKKRQNRKKSKVPTVAPKLEDDETKRGDKLKLNPDELFVGFLLGLTYCTNGDLEALTSYKIHQEELDKLYQYAADATVQGPRKFSAKWLAQNMPETCQDLREKRVTDRHFSFIACLACFEKATGIRVPAFNIDNNHVLAFLLAKSLTKLMMTQFHNNYKPQSSANSSKAAIELFDELSLEMYNEFLANMETEEVSIVDIARRDTCKTLLDRLCNKYAKRMDAVLFQGKRGAFLQSSSLYKMPLAKVKASFEFKLEKHCDLLYNQSKKFQVLIRQLWLAATSIFFGHDKLSSACWECNTPCEGDIFTCSGCDVAIYCGEKCFRQAWEDGHKRSCKFLPDRLDCFEDSMERIDKSLNERKAAGLPNTFSTDHIILQTAMSLDTSMVRNKIMKPLKGPSMKYFYKHMKIIKIGKWWPLEGYDPRDVVFAKTDSAEERVFFSHLCTWLCFDMYAFIQNTPEVTGKDSELFYDLLRVQEIAPIKLSRQRFLELYESNLAHDKTTHDRLLENTLQNMANHKEQVKALKKDARSAFRDAYHKVTKKVN